MQGDMPPALVITGRDIWEKLVHIEQEISGLPTRVNDHETRLRVIEGRRYVTPWQLWTVTASAGGLIIGALGLLIKFL